MQFLVLNVRNISNYVDFMRKFIEFIKMWYKLGCCLVDNDTSKKFYGCEIHQQIKAKNFQKMFQVSRVLNLKADQKPSPTLKFFQSTIIDINNQTIS